MSPLPNTQRVFCTSVRKDVEFSFKKRDTNKDYRKTPLYIAALKGFTNIAEMLLKHQADPNIENDCDNVTPLYIATAKGYTEIVSMLLKFKAEPNFCDKLNRTSLYIAAEKGHYDIVKVLLKNNGDPNTSSNWYDSCQDKKTPIQIASEKGNENIVTLLLKYKADPNIRDKYNKTALYLASAEHHTAIVKILLQHGAELISSVAWTIIHRLRSLQREVMMI
ncbi:sex-determining protein fem-1-like [Mytilus trossulus]|uniref:sex-determining protein fem-1-like n=1 Tax=Mytilus trossulus TaxID=6551 RepID=UPI00300619CD